LDLDDTTQDTATRQFTGANLVDARCEEHVDDRPGACASIDSSVLVLDRVTREEVSDCILIGVEVNVGDANDAVARRQYMIYGSHSIGGMLSASQGFKNEACS
jgi:hypothetical protein